MYYDQERAREWSLWLALGTMGVVLILSWSNQVSWTNLLWRSGVSFGVVYGLTLGSLYLFDKSGSDSGTDVNEKLNKDTTIPIGSMFDHIAGEESLALDKEFAAGQINDILKDTNVSHEQQAELIRKMGWSTEEN